MPHLTPSRRPRQTPYVDPKLVAHLAERFPDQCPDFNATDRKVWADKGAADVVRYLNGLLAEQANGGDDHERLPVRR